MTALYSSAKPFWFPEKLQALSQGEITAPVHVRIKPTNVCNHDCHFCAYRRDGLQLGSGMSVRDRIPREKMMEIVNDLVAMGVRAVTFSGGGEPLVYPHIVEAVRGLAAGGVQVATLTNGAQLRGKVADAFADCATWIRVSIDGWDADSYARSRNVRTSEFGKVIGNLEAFAKRGSACVLGANVVVGQDNADKVFGLARLLKEAGVSTVKISPCIVGNEPVENDAYHAQITATVHEQIERAKGDLMGPGFHVVDHYHSLGTNFAKSYDWCPFLQFLTVIGADCRVYTCQDKAYTESGSLGSIRDVRFRDFWFSEENIRAIRAVDPSRDCLHHCVAQTKNQHLFDYLQIHPGHVAFV